MLISKNQIRTNYPKIFLLLKFINRLRIFFQSKLDSLSINHRNKKLKKISNEVYSKISSQVCRGPFKGIKLHNDNGACWHPAKILGAYEQEIYPVIERIKSKDYERIVNIGCGDGYFAVGLAKLCSDSKVDAYDIDNKTLKKAERLAKYNNLTNITFQSECSHEDFKNKNQESNLIFCDCEGAELHLLNPDQSPDLLYFDILVETHDHVEAGLTELIIERFKKTHKIEIIHSVPRSFEDYPELKIFKKSDRQLALNEFRHGIGTWIWIEKKLS